MDEKRTGMLLSLLIILKVFGKTEASCRVSGTSADCRYQDLTSVPQDLRTDITSLDLENNLITTLSQSDFSRYGSLTRLDLENNRIATINSETFHSLSDLIFLYLQGNRLSDLSSDIFTGLGNLQTLSLRNNKISDIQAMTFSSTPQLRTLVLHINKLTTLRSDMFTGLGNLQNLWLYNNEISDIQAGTFNSTPELRTLDLSVNKLTNLRSDMFTGLGNLQKLYLYSNEISDIQDGTFNSIPQLGVLSLHHNKLTTLRSDMHMFTGLGNVQKLYLSNNEISDIQAGTFNSTLQLRTLWLHGNKLTNLTSDMFTGLGNLETLLLSNNEISNMQAGTFNSTPQLRTLRLGDNKLHVVVVNLRSDMFTGLGNLHTLDLYSNEISDIQAGTFSATSQLRYLSLYNNKLTNPRSHMFTGPENLETLVLDSNEISDIQAETFNSAPQLRTLRLGGNNLTNLRSDMFTGLGNLENLYLFHNKISNIQAGTFDSNLRRIELHNNEISDIQAGTFNSTPQLGILYLHYNKLTTLRSDMFTGLGNLHELDLHNNEISDIQAGTFNSTSQLWQLDLQHNRLTVLRAETFAKLSSLWHVNIDNNPWQCDCRMVPFRKKMTGSRYWFIEYQITCEEPRNFQGQKLKDISPEDLICEEPTIVRFERVHNSTMVQGEMLHLVCDASGIPTPDITVILPSGLNATVESSGRVTVDVNGTITINNVTVADAGLYACVGASPIGSTFAILVVDVHFKEPTTSTVAPATSLPYIVRFETIDYSPLVLGETLYLVCETSGIPTPDITVILPSGLNATVQSSGRVTVEVNGTMTINNVTAADAGLYVCIAASPVGTTFAILVVDVHFKEPTISTVAPATSLLPITSTLNKPKSSTSYHESTPTLSIPSLTASALSKQPQPAPTFSLPVLIGSVCGSVAGTVLIGTIILTIWHKRKTQNPPTPPVVFSNASAKVTIGEHDQTGQGRAQATSEFLTNARSSELVPGHALSQVLEYEDVVLPPSNTEPNVAGLTQQPAEYQSLGPNRNRAPSDELPPLPPPRNNAAGCYENNLANTCDNLQNYQPLTKTTSESAGAYDTQHYYLSLKRT